MRWLFLILLAVSSAAFAQQDTTRQFKEKLTKADSSSQRINTKIDSIQGKINGLLNPDLSVNALAGRIKFDKRRAAKDSITFHKKI